MAITIARSTFEQLVGDLVDRSLGPCKQALEDAAVTASQIDEVVLVGGMTRMPKVQEIVKNFFGKEPHKGVNPDEVVAIGAAIQAGVLAGEVKDLLLLDVTPLSLGIETMGGIMTPLIQRNTTIPTRKSEVFSTASDSQTSVEVHVLQGERPMARDNRTLGKFHLDGIPPAPRGTPQIEVTFDIDANGIVNVTAKDKATGKEQAITISGASGLSKDEVDRMVKDAQAHAADDAGRREVIDARNQADALIHSVEKTLTENKAKLGAEAAQVEGALARAKDAVKGDDKAAIDAKTEALMTASQKLGEKVYADMQAQQAAAGAAGAAGGPEQAKPADDNVVDAEVKEVKKG